jgi:hypothetical protein
MSTSLPEIHRSAETAALTREIGDQQRVFWFSKQSSRCFGAADPVDQMFLRL